MEVSLETLFSPLRTPVPVVDTGRCCEPRALGHTRGPWPKGRTRAASHSQLSTLFQGKRHSCRNQNLRRLRVPSNPQHHFFFAPFLPKILTCIPCKKCPIPGKTCSLSLSLTFTSHPWRVYKSLCTDYYLSPFIFLKVKFKARTGKRELLLICGKNLTHSESTWLCTMNIVQDRKTPMF